MNDRELKDLLLSTCPVLPGQEARAWAHLQGRLEAPRRSGLPFLPPLRSFAYTAVALVLAAGIFVLGLSMRPSRHALVFADSQTPGIYATSFYSHTAGAQVIWLNGMDPVSDQPTYLDPTTKVSPQSAAGSVKSSNRL